MQTKRKWLSILLTLCMVLMSVPTVAFAVAADADWGSDYDTAKEFTISTEAELRAFAAMVNEGKDFANKTVKLADNITMSDELWVPAGSVDFMSDTADEGDNFFAGIFDGQSHTISGLTIDYGKTDNDPLYDAAGLFGNVSGTVKDVSLTGLSISAAGDDVGGIAGNLMDNAVISRCTVQGSISGAVYEGDGDAYGSQMGGIAGRTENTCENVRIENCVNEAVLNGEKDVGGIIGLADGRYEQSVTLLNCTNRGKVNGGSYHVGGIVGSADGTVISSCINEGAVTGTYDDNIQLGNRGVGGIVGNAVDEVELTDCRNSGDIVAPQQEWVGGIAGRLHQGSSVNGCTNSGAIQGGDHTGGIVGYADAYVDGYQVAGCANTGSVSGANAVGGIVGHTSASEEENATVSVTDCTNSGAVSGESAVGGIVGDHSSDYAASDVKTAATVSGCINTGSVPAGAGAIVGNNNTTNGHTGKVESNFWPESVGQNAVGSGAGSENNPVDAVTNNSSYDQDGNFNTPVTGEDGSLTSICEVVGHSLTKVEGKAATCTEEGSKEYWECTVCGKLFDDEQGKTEITEKDVIVAALGHSWGEPEWNWTEDGCTAVFTCRNDATHTESVEAEVTTEIRKAPTCTEAGNIEYWYCEQCGKYFSDEALTEEIAEEDTVLPALGHQAVKVEAKAPTATEAGNIEYWYCEQCGKYFSDEALTREIAKEDTVLKATGEKGEPDTQEPATDDENTEIVGPATGDAALPMFGALAALSGAALLLLRRKK